MLRRMPRSPDMVYIATRQMGEWEPTTDSPNHINSTVRLCADGDGASALSAASVCDLKSPQAACLHLAKWL